MIQFFKNLAMALLSMPVKGATEEQAIYEWRQRVAVSIVVLGGVMFLYIVATLGYLSFGGQGISGFALASDVRILFEQGQMNAARGIESDIKSDRTLQCNAIMEGNGYSMDFAYRHLQVDLDAAIVNGKASPRIPECRELIPEAPMAPGPAVTPTPVPSPAAKAAAAAQAK